MLTFYSFTKMSGISCDERTYPYIYSREGRPNNVIKCWRMEIFAISNIKQAEFTNLETMEHSNICIYSELPKKSHYLYRPISYSEFYKQHVTLQHLHCSTNFQHIKCNFVHYRKWIWWDHTGVGFYSGCIIDQLKLLLNLDWSFLPQPNRFSICRVTPPPSLSVCWQILKHQMSRSASIKSGRK